MATQQAQNSASAGGTQGYQAITIRPMTGILGAEIEGVDLSKPTEAITAEIRQALAEYLVLVFRDQELTHDEYKDFARSLGGPLEQTRFGPPAEDEEGVLQILDVDGYKKHGRTNFISHIDESMDEIPNKYTLLYALEVPEAGGDTEFTNLYAAYDALSEPMKNFLSGLTSLHGTIANSEWDRIMADQAPEILERRWSRYKDLVAHPLVTTIPETGRKQLFYNPNRSVHIPELNQAESRSVLQFLHAHVMQSEFTCRTHYRLKTVCLWDNRCTLHKAMTDFWSGRRRMLRIETSGDLKPG